MHSLPLVEGSAATTSLPSATARRLPSWLKRNLPLGNEDFFTDRLIADLGLATVCESARCPNRMECWSRRTATFMILGDICTRPCGFCSVAKGIPLAVEEDEPDRLAEAVVRLGLRHVVITSVTRDDLPDGGASHFYHCLLAVRRRVPSATLEVLTPDFMGDLGAVDQVLKARPHVFNHNMETVPRFYTKVRGRADYQRSLNVLGHAKQSAPDVLSKTGLMLGLGESRDELLDVLADLRAIDCDALTLGQYLNPSFKHVQVARYLPPEEFDELAAIARRMGFKQVASGPFVRSSYHAEEMIRP